MKTIIILLCVLSITVSVFFIGKYGIKKKENAEYVNAESIFLDKE